MKGCCNLDIQRKDISEELCAKIPMFAKHGFVWVFDSFEKAMVFDREVL